MSDDLTLTGCPVCRATAEVLRDWIDSYGARRRETACVRGHRRPYPVGPQADASRPG